uniref:Uncharacterized protein n=1 Tax=Ralstonia solanacearum TaxID=305 RepID=A0A0S4X1R4_RALSL|nr:protein of unknown function [Ralstonia solanacearum]
MTQSYPLPVFPQGVCVECVLCAMGKQHAFANKNG